MSAPYRNDERHAEFMDFMVSASGDVAAIRDAIRANTAALSSIALCLSKLVALAEKGGRHE